MTLSIYRADLSTDKFLTVLEDESLLQNSYLWAEWEDHYQRVEDEVTVIKRAANPKFPKDRPVIRGTFLGRYDKFVEEWGRELVAKSILGRIFSPDWELRWMRLFDYQSGKPFWRTVALWDVSLPSKLVQELEEKPLSEIVSGHIDKKTKSYILQKGGKAFGPGLPPLKDKKEYLSIKIQSYKQKDEVLPFLERFSDIVLARK